MSCEHEERVKEDARMKLRTVKHGMYVTAGSGDDKDVGVVCDLNTESAVGDEVYVAWSNGDRTWIEASELRLSRISPMEFVLGEE